MDTKFPLLLEKDLWRHSYRPVGSVTGLKHQERIHFANVLKCLQEKERILELLTNRMVLTCGWSQKKNMQRRSANWQSSSFRFLARGVSKKCLWLLLLNQYRLYFHLTPCVFRRNITIQTSTVEQILDAYSLAGKSFFSSPRSRSVRTERLQTIWHSTKMTFA